MLIIRSAKGVPIIDHWAINDLIYFGYLDCFVFDKSHQIVSCALLYAFTNVIYSTKNKARRFYLPMPSNCYCCNKPRITCSVSYIARLI